MIRDRFPALLIVLFCASLPASADTSDADPAYPAKAGASERVVAEPFADADVEPGAYVLSSSVGDAPGVVQVSKTGPWGDKDTGRWAAVAAPAGLFGQPGLVLVPSDAPAELAYEETDRSLRLSESGSPVFVYNQGMMLPDGVPEDRRRACYIHPVYDLDGRVISDDFPKDHYHHRGIAWMWPGVWIGDRKVDEWHIKGVHQRFVGWLGRETGPVCAVLGIEAGWFLDDGTKKAEEISWYRVFRSSDTGRAIDVHYTLRAVDEPIRLQGTLVEEKGYGGFCMRFAPRTDTRIPSPAGIEAKDSDRVPYPWVDLSAKFGGGDAFSGAAIFIHPDNPGYPNGWTIRHYGFLGVAWPGLETYTIEPGQSLTLQYRVWIHRGDAEEGDVEEAWRHYTE